MVSWVLFTGQLRLARENIRSILNHTPKDGETRFSFFLWASTPDEEIEFILTNIPNAIIHKIPEYSIPGSVKISNKIPDRVENWIRQYYIINQAYQILKNEFKSGDIVIRSRTDLLLERQVEYDLLGIDILFPGVKFGIGYTDYFAVMKAPLLGYYARTFDYMLYYYFQEIFLPPEVLLGISFSDRNIHVKTNKKLPRILLKSTDDGIIARGTFLNENSQYYQRSEFTSNRDRNKPNILMQVVLRMLDLAMDLLSKRRFPNK